MCQMCHFDGGISSESRRARSSDLTKRVWYSLLRLWRRRWVGRRPRWRCPSWGRWPAPCRRCWPSLCHPPPSVRCSRGWGRGCRRRAGTKASIYCKQRETEARLEEKGTTSCRTVKYTSHIFCRSKMADKWNGTKCTKCTKWEWDSTIRAWTWAVATGDSCFILKPPFRASLNSQIMCERLRSRDAVCLKHNAVVTLLQKYCTHLSWTLMNGNADISKKIIIE